MSEQVSPKKDERVLASLAHGSIIFGPFTNGIGGIVAALVIWVTQKEKSAYAAAQALQALVYQVVTFAIAGLAWCCWGLMWMALILGPLAINPEAYDQAPPAGMWVGLILLIVPIAIGGLTILYGLWGAARCWGGHDFRYAIIGNWLESQRADA
jgi:uncharacterized Tic20 family protein